MFPVTYWTQVRRDDGKHFIIWRMWLGRVYDVTDVTL
jgi:hypothetical protein